MGMVELFCISRLQEDDDVVWSCCLLDDSERSARAKLQLLTTTVELECIACAAASIANRQRDTDRTTGSYFTTPSGK